MQEIPLHIENYSITDQIFSLHVPDAGFIQNRYKEEKKNNAKTLFPYWTQVWPAALAISQFIAEQPDYIKDKEVMELAAGLGLPSFVAATAARKVICSDYAPEAVAVVEQSVLHNQVQNMECRVLDWHALPADINPGVLLLSDINYNPEEFSVLFSVLNSFLKKGTTIILSTPQRLMAKPFIEQLQPWCAHKADLPVLFHGQTVMITVFVLKEASSSITA